MRACFEGGRAGGGERQRIGRERKRWVWESGGDCRRGGGCARSGAGGRGVGFEGGVRDGGDGEGFLCFLGGGGVKSEGFLLFIYMAKERVMVQGAKRG